MAAQISIIVPVFNAKEYLPRCLDSILSQSFSDFEVLLVNDGSTDGSEEICDLYETKDSRVKVFHRKNAGVSAARNVGLANSTGEWVCFTDADDVLLENGLDLLVSGVSDRVDMVWGGYNVYNEIMECTYAVPERVKEELTSEQGIEMMFRPAYYRYLGFAWGRLFRHSVIKSFGIRFDEDLYYNEDRLFCTRFLCESKNGICFMTNPVYGYIEHARSAMGIIERAYDPKFITDLIAMARMRKKIRGRFPMNKALAEVLDASFYIDWRRMVGMVGFHEETGGWVRIKTVIYLISQMGLKSFLTLDWTRNRNRIKKFINKYL